VSGVRKFTDAERKIKQTDATRVWKAKNPNYHRDWARANSMRRAAQSLKWYAKNKEVKKASVSQWRKENAAWYRATAAASRLAKREKIAGRVKPLECEVCGSTDRICFDHCHASNKFRGWICFWCNLSIGYAKDSPVLLRKLATYVKKAEQRSHK
jgi:hypothetical protein